MNQFRTLRNIRLGIKTLMLHKLRSLLTMLGVVFGVASVVAMLAVGEGASKDALERIRKLGSTNIIITSVKPAADESGGQRGSPWQMLVYGLLYDDVQRAKETFSAIQVWTGPTVMARVGTPVTTPPELVRAFCMQVMGCRSTTRVDSSLYSSGLGGACSYLPSLLTGSLNAQCFVSP